MPNTKPSVAYIFDHFNKNTAMLNYVNTNLAVLPELISTSISPTHPKAWRAAMLLGHFMKKNDARLQEYITDFIAAVPLVFDGHQRQLFIILDKLTLNEDQEGVLFNYAMTIWETIHKIPSTRIRAFQTMFKITKNYPELRAELNLFTKPYYTETLSPAIKVSLLKLAEKL